MFPVSQKYLSNKLTHYTVPDVSTKPEENNYLKEMPNEICLHIFKYLNHKDLKSVCRASKYLREIILACELKLNITNIFERARVKSPILVPQSNYVGFKFIDASFRWIIFTCGNSEVYAYNVVKQKTELLGRYKNFKSENIIITHETVYIIDCDLSSIYTRNLKLGINILNFSFSLCGQKPILFKNNLLETVGVLVSGKIKIFKDSKFQKDIVIPIIENTSNVFKKCYLLNDGTIVVWFRDTEANRSYLAIGSSVSIENKPCSIYCIDEKIYFVDSNGIDIFLTFQDACFNEICCRLDRNILRAESQERQNLHALNDTSKLSSTYQYKRNPAEYCIYENMNSIRSYRVIHEKIGNLSNVFWRCSKTQENLCSVILKEKTIYQLTLFFDYENIANTCLIAFTEDGCYTWVTADGST